MFHKAAGSWYAHYVDLSDRACPGGKTGGALRSGTPEFSKIAIDRNDRETISEERRSMIAWTRYLPI